MESQTESVLSDTLRSLSGFAAMFAMVGKGKWSVELPIIECSATGPYIAPKKHVKNKITEAIVFDRSQNILEMERETKPDQSDHRNRKDSVREEQQKNFFWEHELASPMIYFVVPCRSASPRGDFPLHDLCAGRTDLVCRSISSALFFSAGDYSTLDRF